MAERPDGIGEYGRLLGPTRGTEKNQGNGDAR